MSHRGRDNVRLTAFEQRWADHVLGWVTSSEELFHWSARTDFPVADASVFADWHSDPHVAPHVLLIQDHAVAYGEVWSDNDEPAIELGRLIVAPEKRRNRSARVSSTSSADSQGTAAKSGSGCCRRICPRFAATSPPASPAPRRSSKLPSTPRSDSSSSGYADATPALRQ